MSRIAAVLLVPPLGTKELKRLDRNCWTRQSDLQHAIATGTFDDPDWFRIERRILDAVGAAPDDRPVRWRRVSEAFVGSS